MPRFDPRFTSTFVLTGGGSFCVRDPWRFLDWAETLAFG